ncbi:MAG: Protein-arginine kinase [Planctomycetes bacterium]|nr:Protein-arginine kinase [Planctomycetota bacterium]
MKLVTTFEAPAALGGEWLTGRGTDADIVISSRIRLARNLRGHRFGAQADAEERAAIEEEIRGGLSRSEFAAEMSYLALHGARPLDGELLVERHLISKELHRGEGPRGVCWSPDESVSVMVCEEDHVRLQVLRSGFELEAAWTAADSVDDALARRLDVAFSSRFGYLTCCPTNVGTGLRASVMLHLPALVYTKHIEKVFQAGAKMGLAVRGLYGEGTQPSSDFFQISNQTCLGRSEHDLVESLQRVVPQFIQYERKMRDGLLRGDRAALEDRSWRAWGILRAARTISTEEALEHLSALRLGAHLSILPGAVTMELVNELFLMCQPAHLQRLGGGPMEPRARDVARADLMRRRLGEL